MNTRPSKTAVTTSEQLGFHQCPDCLCEVQLIKLAPGVYTWYAYHASTCPQYRGVL